jgi:hypothetical protein
MECWNPGDMDVSGRILRTLDAGHPCRHDEVLHFDTLIGERKLMKHSLINLRARIDYQFN